MTAQPNPNLLTCKWAITFHKTFERADGIMIDMYLLHDDETGEGIVSIGVPHRRDDIAKFMLRSCIAGQRVLRQLNIIDIEDFKP
jgi:hypothetical protein